MAGGGLHTHSRNIELGNSRWQHRLPLRTREPDRGRLSRATDTVEHVVYRAERDLGGIYIQAAFDPGVTHNPRRAIQVFTSADGKAWELLADRSRTSVSRRIGGTRRFWQEMACYNVGGYKGDFAAWNQVQLWSYKFYQFAPQPPPGTRFFKIQLNPTEGRPRAQPSTPAGPALPGGRDLLRRRDH